MAIKKVKRDSRFDLISVRDEAVDIDASDIKGYKKTLDTDHLKMKAGQHATLFVVKPITQMKRAEFDDEHVSVELPDDFDELDDLKKKAVKPKVKIINQSQLVVKYFQECVVGIKNYDVKTKKYVDEAVGEPEEYGSRVIQDIGDQCMILSNLGSPTKKD